MVDSIINIITLDLLVKNNHFYYQRTVQVRNGALKYFKQDDLTKHLFQANLSDIILIDKDTTEDKPEILLSSKSNAFSLFKLTHDKSHILLSFKTQLERLIEIENNRIKEEEEKVKITAKTKPLNEIIAKYSLVVLNSLPNEISDIIESEYLTYKCYCDIEYSSTDLSKIMNLDQTLFLYDNIHFMQNYGQYLLISKRNNQLFLCKFISITIFILSIVYFNKTYHSFYQMIMILLLMCPFLNKISMFAIETRNKISNKISLSSSSFPSDQFILKSTTYLNMNMMHILEYIIIECNEIIIKNRTNVVANETFMVYSNLKQNSIMLIESSNDLSQILSVYVLQSNTRMNKAQIVLYSILVDRYSIDYQKDAFLKLSKMIGKIHLRLEEGCFNQNESFLVNDDVNNNYINDSMISNNEMKFEFNDYIDIRELDLYGQTMMLDYKSIITSNDDDYLLKEEFVINKHKDTVIQFALNYGNLVLINKYLKNAVLIPEERMIQFSFEFKSIGNVIFKASSEYEDVEIDGIEYTFITYKNNNKHKDINKSIENFGYYIWCKDKNTHLCSWIKYNLNYVEQDKEAFMIELQIYIEEYQKIEEIISVNT